MFFSTVLLLNLTSNTHHALRAKAKFTAGVNPSKLVARSLLGGRGGCHNSCCEKEGCVASRVIEKCILQEQRRGDKNLSLVLIYKVIFSNKGKRKAGESYQFS